jgi:hypothetical protein
MKQLLLILILVGLCSVTAQAQSPWFWGYSGDQNAVGIVLNGEDTPQVGGHAFCSAPYFGVQIGAGFYWPSYPCSSAGNYYMTSYQASTYPAPNPPPNQIWQDGWMKDYYTHTTIGRYRAFEACDGTPAGYHLIENIGSCEAA